MCCRNQCSWGPYFIAMGHRVNLENSPWPPEILKHNEWAIDMVVVSVMGDW